MTIVSTISISSTTNVVVTTVHNDIADARIFTSCTNCLNYYFLWTNIAPLIVPEVVELAAFNTVIFTWIYPSELVVHSIDFGASQGLVVLCDTTPSILYPDDKRADFKITTLLSDAEIVPVSTLGKL